MHIQDFAKEYETKTEGELLHLALAPSELTDEANAALSAELRKRGLATKELKNFQQQETERKQKEKNDLGRLWLSARTGIGRQRFCKGNYQFDPSSEIEEFTTTVFILIFFMPLIPVGTYRVRRSKKSLSSHLRGIEKLPLSWEQVMQVWLVATLGVLILILALKVFIAYR